MVRTFLIAAALGLAAGFLPASAQSKASCEEVCLKGRCAPSNVEYNQSICMNKCVQSCNMARQKAK
jgi:hypothetical protein